MKVPFRQGLVSFSRTRDKQPLFLRKVDGASIYVELVVGTSSVIAAVAHGQSDYAIIEPKTVPNAWGPLTRNVNYWLYWDLDLFSTVRTFGHTVHPPITSRIAPTNPLPDQHWFDTTAMLMKVFSGNVWTPKLRVFAGNVQSNSLSQQEQGSQVGLTSSASVGRIIFDAIGKPVRKKNGEFFTTEDSFLIAGSVSQTVKMEYAVAAAEAQHPIPQFSVVKYSDFDKIVLASYDDIGQTTLGVATSNLNTNDIGDVIFSGIITNLYWDWPEVNAPLWINGTGQFVTTSDSLTEAKSPIARVLGRNTIMFGMASSGDGSSSSDNAALILKYIAGGNLSGHRMVLLDSGNLQYADNTHINNAQRVLGMTVDAGVNGSMLKVQVSGEIEEPSWNWDINRPIYLGVNGTLTQIAPTAPATFCLVVGLPITTTMMYISIRDPIALLTGE